MKYIAVLTFVLLMAGSSMAQEAAEPTPDQLDF